MRGPALADPPDQPDSGADLARRRFFRQFAGEIATTAATVMGAAQALQRTSAELAGVILDPTRLHEPPARAADAPEAVETRPVFRTAVRLESGAIVFVYPRALPRTVT